VVEAIITETGYKEYLRQNYPDADARIENVDEVVAAAEVYTQGRDDPSLAAFLEEIALVADVDALDDIKGQVTLMTLHNAKGLEYDCVIIAGLEDGLVPHYNSLDTIEELEEERRLFYVGMTRARKKLFFSYANMRRRMGVVEGGAPSRFLAEVPEECIEGAAEPARGGPSGGDFDELLLPFKGTRGAPLRGRSAPTEYEDYSQEEVAYAVGMRILHNDFGRGIVRKVEGSGENLRVTVIFDGGGERKFLAHYAPMRPLA
jgi:DNA helicase-2/ATP-dependent DNA helicase PcrA